MRTCISTADSGAPQNTGQNSGHSSNVGAIAGGVVGGVVFIVLATYLVWRFCIKNRRQAYDADEYPEEYEGSGEKPATEAAGGGSDFGRNRMSTHSVRSMASTVMTRASNVIQIAFIPGITDRSTHDGHESSIPPVPSIPMRANSSTVSSPYSDHHPTTPYSDAASGTHYFMPHDLRESHFSDFSSSTDEGTEADVRSARHHSLASSLARESVGSTVYHGEATPPAQIMHRGKAAVVSVKSSQSNTPGVDVPGVPAIDYFKYAHPKQGAARPGSSRLKETTAAYGDDSASARSTEGAAASKNEAAVSSNAAAPVATGVENLGDAVETQADGQPSRRKPSSAALASAIQEAHRLATRQPTHGGLGSLSPRTQERAMSVGAAGTTPRDESPFSDEHAVE